ncbi:MAG: MOP flippase family protein [Elusimicrobia bacterium]|nr:MOP flippase family protein [Elusimicrobiota bacterium]
MSGDRPTETSSGPLRGLVQKAARWSVGARWLRHAIQGVALMALARFLQPEDFGLVGMAAILVGAANALGDFGTMSVLVQRPDPSRRLWTSLFWVQVALGLAMTGVLWLAAPLTASFFHEPRVSALLRGLSVSVAVASLGMAHQARLMRAMRFDLLGMAEVFGVAGGAILGLSAALSDAGPWSLVVQGVAGSALSTACLWLAEPWRPGGRIDVAELRSVSGYSLTMTGSSIATYANRQLDQLLVGRFLGAQALGWYSLATRLMLLPLLAITWNVSRVLFPALSRVQHDLGKFRRGYLDAVSLVAMVSFPMMLALMAAADPFVRVAFGKGWEAAVPLVRILSFVGLVQSITSLSHAVFRASGRTGLQFGLDILGTMVLAAAFWVGLRWGAIGVAAAYAVATAALLYPGLLVVLPLMGLALNDWAKALWRPLVCAGGMGGVLVVVSATLPDRGDPFGALALLGLAGAVVYSAATAALNREALAKALPVLGVR